MISISLLICIVGFALWLIFTKVQAVADTWVSEFGRLMFFAGLLAYLLNFGTKVVF